MRNLEDRKDYYIDYMRKRRKILANKGICPVCGVRKKLANYSICANCLEVQRSYRKKVREILKNARK